MLMLAEDGSILAASDESAAGAGRAFGAADAPLRSSYPHYLESLGGELPFLTPQQVDLSRTTAAGVTLHERLLLRRTAWGASLTVVDQTELQSQKLAEIQSARLASLGFMMAGVCHELTNPLTALHSIVQILRSENEPSPSLLKKGLDNIAVNVRRILDISRRLLKFSRVGDEPRILFPIDDAVDEALYVLRQDKVLDDIEIVYQRDPSAQVTGNIGQIREIFLNLLANAAQAVGPNGGRIVITTLRLTRSVEVLVSDDGPGVPAELRSRIFEPFFTTRARADGTGLGLAISNEMAREHGGIIELRQTSKRGATFCVCLPAELT